VVVFYGAATQFGVTLHAWDQYGSKALHGQSSVSPSSEPLLAVHMHIVIISGRLEAVKWVHY